MKKPTTRARPKRETGQADEGVRWCMQLMTSASWRTGISDAQTAELFGVSIHTARGWAGDAARTLRILIGDSEEVRARLVVLFEDIHARAVEEKDYKSAVAALSKQADVLGLASPKVAVQVNVQSYAALDDAQMLEKVEAQIERLLEVRTHLLAKRGAPALPAYVEVIDVEREG